MMKKFGMIVLAFFLFSACAVNMSDNIPEGQWRSDEPKIWIDYYPRDGITDGEYVLNSDVKQVFFMTESGGGFEVWDSSLRQDGMIYYDAEKVYLAGTYKVRGGKLILKPFDWAQELSGYKKIVLELVEEEGE